MRQVAFPLLLTRIYHRLKILLNMAEFTPQPAPMPDTSSRPMGGPGFQKRVWIYRLCAPYSRSRCGSARKLALRYVLFYECKKQLEDFRFSELEAKGIQLAAENKNPYDWTDAEVEDFLRRMMIIHGIQIPTPQLLLNQNAAE
jgi:hypothetical protein